MTRTDIKLQFAKYLRLTEKARIMILLLLEIASFVEIGTGRLTFKYLKLHDVII